MSANILLYTDDLSVLMTYNSISILWLRYIGKNEKKSDSCTYMRNVSAPQ